MPLAGDVAPERGSLHTFARAPRRFLVVRAASLKCGARLCACIAARLFVAGGASVRAGGRAGARKCSGLRESAVAPAARALQRWLSGCVRRPARLVAPVRRGCRSVLVSELPYPGRRTPRRLQAASAAGERCAAREPARAYGALRLDSAVRGSARRQSARGRAGQAHFWRAFVCVHRLPRRARRCADSWGACAWRGRAGRGWRGALGALCQRKPLRTGAVRVPPLASECPTLAGSRCDESGLSGCRRCR